MSVEDRFFLSFGRVPILREAGFSILYGGNGSDMLKCIGKVDKKEKMHYCIN